MRGSAGAVLPVPVRVRASRRLLLSLAALAAAGALAAGVLALAGPGPAVRSVPPYSVRLHGLPLQAANSTAWWAAPEGERVAVVKALTQVIGGPKGFGSTLSDARAHRLFDTVCAPAFTSHFLLYEIYNRAAGFKSLGG
jgi:hypothetical protein